MKTDKIFELPRDGDFAGPAGACCYDHISDHNARRRTWRHCEGQRRRPALPGQTSNAINNTSLQYSHVTPGSTALWHQETVGSSPATRTTANVCNGFTGTRFASKSVINIRIKIRETPCASPDFCVIVFGRKPRTGDREAVLTSGTRYDG